MKRCLPILAMMLLLAACDQVIFTESQPPKVKPLSEIPAVLQGIFLDQDGDSLYVHEQSFSYYSDEYSSFQDVYLSDSAVLKEYKGHFFYSTPIMLETEKYWLCYLLHSNENGFDLYTMDPEDVVKLAKLQEITSKIGDIEEGDNAYYLFEPKKKDYKKIISDTIFTKMISFTRISSREE